ncbi:MAG: AAA family ATPase [Simkaniaceae bacterium]|nr:AAA family ATPase [Simkaniaceae bacterium]
MNIVLFGLKGSGKTTFGKRLAKEMGCAFIDTDRLIEEIYQLNRQKTLTTCQIYQEVGPVAFRALEYEVVQSLQDVQNSVIAVGGGAMMLYENVDALSKQSHLIYLYFEREKLKKRVLSAHPLPAFLDPKDPEASFDKMYEEREEYYAKIKANRIDVTEMSDDDVIDQIHKVAKHGKQ